MPFVVLQNGKDGTSSKVRGVCFKPELTVVVWVGEDRSSGEAGLQTCERVGFRVAPSEDLVFLCEICEGVRDARLIQTYSFLPASWTGDTHEETDFLPIGDREEKDVRLLNCRTDNLGTRQVLVAKYLRTRVRRGKSGLLAMNEQGLA